MTQRPNNSYIKSDKLSFGHYIIKTQTSVNYHIGDSKIKLGPEF